MADDMIDGSSCSWCGVYFEKTHGYPVICESCHSDWRKENPKKDLLKECGVQVAHLKEM